MKKTIPLSRVLEHKLESLIAEAQEESIEGRSLSVKGQMTIVKYYRPLIKALQHAKVLLKERGL